MQDVPSNVFSNLAVAIPILLALIGAVVFYLVLMVRAIIDMLRHDVHGVLLTFAFLALIPFPLILVMGIMVLIIWHYHKRDILAGERQTR
jgi:predicted transporter